MRLILLIAAAGAAGAVGRYLLGGWTYRLLGDSFPYGTLAVNMLGCFLLGTVQQLGQQTDLLTQETRVAIAIGLLGALTTYSTFGYETFRLVEDGRWQPALANIAAHLLLGLFAIWLGITLVRAGMGGG
ncbi:MAG: fluoride efflux transporter CrcB [Planctomycetales bacterium]|nr:fluoride efflux transporter CrcB [Planctomycetales bacterium]NIM09959.1 fluoride efflux transporter CrcB [Planctomycetales bacterium]NIN09399.1 fluoride efflux transporter CrcB [Planctomycetales bacterium]NIN78506.1 fluoride efflux transporter CrcB [Planctomycetales bacterium]NIO35699.1 fluoride efflux transporter CrcB [Planctomycetales bacterium]